MSEKIVFLSDLSQIEREAAEWIARLDGDDLSDEDAAALAAWRQQSSQHEAAFERVSRLWGGMKVLEELKDHAAADDVTEVLQKDGNEGRTLIGRRMLVGASAASLVAAGGAAIYKFARNTAETFTDAFQTAIGEQRVIDLPDGSQVILNTASAAEIRYDKNARIVRLTKGEAYFDVAPNKARPFSVETGNGVVTAVGTAFSVRIDHGRMDVLVAEGRVAIAPKSSASHARSGEGGARLMEMSAGQLARIDQRVESISMIEGAALEHELDWRDGMLSFKGETLEQVIKVLSRYTDTEIEIASPQLGQQRIDAYYRVGDVEALFQALNIMSGIEVERVDERHVRLYRAS
jgi:transmembrane sensor